MKTKVISESAPPPVGPYPHARRVGDLIFVSGMGPRQAGKSEIPGVHQDACGRVVSHDIEAQTRATIENIAKVLKDAGSSLKDVVDVQVFLTHMQADFQKFNKVYGEYFAEIGPTRTTVEVLSLPTPIAVELKVIAHQPAVSRGKNVAAVPKKASAPAKKPAAKSAKKMRSAARKQK